MLKQIRAKNCWWTIFRCERIKLDKKIICLFAKVNDEDEKRKKNCVVHCRRCCRRLDFIQTGFLVDDLFCVRVCVAPRVSLPFNVSSPHRIVDIFFSSFRSPLLQLPDSLASFVTCRHTYSIEFVILFLHVVAVRYFNWLQLFFLLVDFVLARDTRPLRVCVRVYLSMTNDIANQNDYGIAFILRHHDLIALEKWLHCKNGVA